MNPKEVLDFAKQKEVRQFDLRFTDLPGLSQHVSYPISQLDEDSFEAGFGIDGSSIRGWAAINESDMLLIPDPSTAHMDPFGEIRTLVMTRVRISPNGSMCAVEGSGMRSISLSLMAAQPRILEPSMPKPASKESSSSWLMG